MVHITPTCKYKGEVRNELISYTIDLLAHDVVFRSDVGCFWVTQQKGKVAIS
jgi:hypothetical protein